MCYTGGLYEVEVLGTCRVAWDGETYKPYREALIEAANNQPWDPKDPGCKVANNLHAQVAIALELEDWGRLELFTAVGTALDRFHGIDGFFVLDRKHFVTLDVTMNPHKDEYKADVVLNPELIENLENAAREIVQFFN